MSGLRPEGGWCWTSGDPEMTYPDPVEWLDEVGYYGDEPLVQRMDWGVPAPSTWLVAHYDEAGIRTTEEFASAEEAAAYAAAIRATQGSEQ